MDADISPEDKAYFEAQRRRREKFFELIGHCVTLYQTVEDYLDEVFAAAIAGDENRAAALFAVARGLESKLNMITAALIGRSDDTSKYWPGLMSRVAKAAKARNEIAHATPANRGETITIFMDGEKMEAVRAERTSPGRMELLKRTKSGETTRHSDDLIEEYRRTEKLFGNLIGFVKLLKGEEVTAHLMDGLSS